MLAPTKTEVLAEKRLLPSIKTKKKIHEADAAIEALKKRHPYLLGVTYYGSRMLSLGHPKSDLDYAIFVDTSRLPHNYRDDDLNDMTNEIAAIIGNHANQTFDVSQGGLFEWTQYVLQNAKEQKLFISPGGPDPILYLFLPTNSMSIIEARKLFLCYLREGMLKTVGFLQGRDRDTVYAGVLSDLSKALRAFERGEVHFEGVAKKREPRPQYRAFPFEDPVGSLDIAAAQEYFARSLNDLISKPKKR